MSNKLVKKEKPLISVCSICGEKKKVQRKRLKKKNIFKTSPKTRGRAVDPHSFFADPDPAVLLNADSDPGAS